MSTPTPVKKMSVTERIRERLAAGAGVRATMPTLDELKNMLGIPTDDTSQDDEILDNLAATISIVESYLGRGVAFVADGVQDFEPVETRNRRLMLFRFPVSVVSQVEVDGQPIAGWRVFPASGILEWGDGCGHGYPRGYCGHEPIIRVTYTAGYPDDAWPDDLMDAILRAFFARWHATGDTGNMADASAGGAVTAVAVDGSSVSYSEPGVNAAEYGGKPWPVELQSVVAILEPYRQRLVTGV